MEQLTWAGLAGLIFLCLCGTVEGLTCKQCQDEDKPSHCRTSIQCGAGEICSTEEYIDGSGLLAYRLGCENALRCKLFTDAKALFGKRDLSSQCFECCDQDGCNANLCQNHVTTQAPHHVTIQTSSTGNHGCSSLLPTHKGCPELFLPFKDSCYLIPPGLYIWSEGQSYCLQHGANLVSINSREEHEFLKNFTLTFNVTNIDSYWTGGFNYPDVGVFQYVDGSAFNYTDWYPSYPRVYGGGLSHMLMLNPASPVAADYKKAQMWDDTSDDRYAIICETSKV